MKKHLDTHKEEFSSVVENGALLGGIAMMCFIGWYAYDFSERHAKKEMPIYQSVQPKKIQTKQHPAKKQAKEEYWIHMY